MDAIDNAIANVVARKASENNAFSTSLKIDNEQERTQRNEKRLQKEQEKAAKKAARLAKKQNSVEVKPSRLDKAFSKLPLLTDTAKEIIEIVKKENNQTIVDIISHLQYTIKARTEKKPRNKKVVDTHYKIGDHVKITASENEHYVGLVGKVVDIKRIRCLIKIGKYKNPIAAYHNDVEVVNINNVSSNEVEEDNEVETIVEDNVQEQVEDTEVETVTEDNEDSDKEEDDEDEELTEENSSLLRWLAKPQESNVASEETDEDNDEVEE